MATNDKGNKQSGEAGSSSASNTSKRGFASMDPERQREIAAEGGRAAHAKGKAHEFTSEEARRAGAMSHKNDPGRKTQGNQQGGSKQ
ncbi:KGG domain-containing protein [Duganella sp. BuS-21]|uniref:KGG domain-containing protein n=1 Tax=Duganella sp. BuS-21 TaxID=2943848 RepID=UPI0035A598DF